MNTLRTLWRALVLLAMTAGFVAVGFAGFIMAAVLQMAVIGAMIVSVLGAGIFVALKRPGKRK